MLGTGHRALPSHGQSGQCLFVGLIGLATFLQKYVLHQTASARLFLTFRSTPFLIVVFESEITCSVHANALYVESGQKIARSVHANALCVESDKKNPSSVHTNEPFAESGQKIAVPVHVNE